MDPVVEKRVWPGLHNTDHPDERADRSAPNDDTGTDRSGPEDPRDPDVLLTAGASLTVHGDAVLNGTLTPGGNDAFMAVDGSLPAGCITPSGSVGISASSPSAVGTLVMDETSALTVSDDTPGNAHPGFLTVQAGASLVVPPGDSEAIPIWNDGVITLTADSAIPAGQILGSGVVLVESGFESPVAEAGMSGTGPTLGADQHLRFDGPNASLFLTNGANDPSTPVLVQNFAPSDDIAIPGSVQSLQVVSTANGDLLELTELVGGVHGTVSTQYIQFDRDYAAENLAFSTEFVGTGAFDAGYTNITVQDAAACFCPGTLIATPDGERPVEELRIGDPVHTEQGATRAVLWIGRRRYHRDFAVGRKDLMPIRIRAGALGNGVPRRDLLVSPRHAMLVRDVLVPAELLVNGRSVLRQGIDDDVTYLHIELEFHDLLIAEGAVTESFVDDNSRSVFENAAEFAALYPDRASRPPGWPAPRVEDGERLVAAQSYVDALAGILPAAVWLPLRGHVDGIENGNVRGWAWCPDQPEAPVLLDILQNGLSVGRVLADRYRADLAEAGIGSGCHGFEAVLPDGAGAITLRRARDGRPVAAA